MKNKIIILVLMLATMLTLEVAYGQSKSEKGNKKEETVAETRRGPMERAQLTAGIFKEGGEVINAEIFEKRYKEWYSNFHPDTYLERDRWGYDYPLVNLGLAFAGEKKHHKAVEYIEQIQGDVDYVKAVLGAMDHIQVADDLKIYSDAILNAFQKASNMADDQGEESRIIEGTTYKDGLLSYYAEALIYNGEYQKAIDITHERLVECDFTGNYASKDVLALSKAYSALARDKDAVDALERVIRSQGAGTGNNLKNALHDIYIKNELSKTPFESYFETLQKDFKQNLFATYESDMIKELAPSFTLLNREGKAVSLAQLKGKVVVLDFWATWCTPCIKSFPGMQQSVYQYANDDDVAFLFIATWQRESNYKELVDNFISRHGYTFEVLMDEMKDKSKATVTAFGIKSIPTKIIIDKNGFIRFRTTGGGATIEETAKEMQAMIELARIAD